MVSFANRVTNLQKDAKGTQPMSAVWTEERVLAMAVDREAAKAGEGLAKPQQWASLGASEAAVWGECRGSGKNPYQVRAELAGGAYKCTCPSRKQPCKHTLALLLLYVRQRGALGENDPPAWVAEWLEGREARAQKKTERSGQPAKPPNAKAQAKRIEKRRERIAEGLDELEIWMSDLVRRGMAWAQSQPGSFWSRPAARLIDAQAPGLARRVHELASIAASGDGWQDRLLERLALMHLIVRGYRRFDELPAPTQADLRTALGWPMTKEELHGEPGVKDTWFVAGRAAEINEEERLRIFRTWLFGRESGRWALLLDFSFKSQPLPPLLPPGMDVAAELVYFLSAAPMRAFIRGESQVIGTGERPECGGSIEGASASARKAIAVQPWIEEWPAMLDSAAAVMSRERCWIADAERAVPVARNFKHTPMLLAVSGGRPAPILCEWRQAEAYPIAVWSDEGYINLSTE